MNEHPIYLCYARSKQELAVRDDLRLIGADVWCGLVLEGKPDPRRAGRKRATIWTERVALPNYLWARMSDEQYQHAFGITKDGVARSRVENLVGTVQKIPDKSERYLREFQDRVEKAYQIALRAKERGEQAPPAFDAGQELLVVGGPLVGLTASFRRIVEDAEGVHVELETALTGKMRVSPAHVKRAS
jgi:transcription antitermination factor NusG